MAGPKNSLWRNVQLNGENRSKKPEVGILQLRSVTLNTLRAMRRDPGSFLGFAIVAVVILAALLAPLLPLDDPTELDLQRKLLSPSTEHLLGTDHLGRD